MMSFAAFVEAVQLALNHLHDPRFQPDGAWLARLPPSATLPGAWQRLLCQTIAALQPALSPGSPLPESTRAQRLQQVLTYRYVQQLTQEEAAARLNITARHLRREQSQAVQAVAQILWQQVASVPLPAIAETLPTGGASADNDWTTQLHAELTALQRHSPAGSAAVGEVLQSVVALLQPVMQAAGIHLRVDNGGAGIFTAMHPIGLRQLLVRCLTEWSRHSAPGVIVGEVCATTNGALLRLTGAPAALAHLAADRLVQELLTPAGTLHLQQSGEATILTLNLPAAPTRRVLVVDDNEDLLHFYRRYLSDTHYEITALGDGNRIFETVAQVQPDVIVLDVMLPDLDGWQLLTNLRHHPASHAIPIIVCSVIQEEALALALGATSYLAKPVRRAALLAALNAVSHPPHAAIAASVG